MRWLRSRRIAAREEAAKRCAEEARREMFRVEQQWTKVNAQAAESDLERLLNGYTRTVKTIFGGQS